jgi:L-2-hydroxyglutarate oxidase LhgO
MERVDYLIIGAGVIGLAVAAELTKRFTDNSTVVMEQHDSFGQETSSRNSEVIHAGIYYPAASLKANLCIQGNRMLYNFCAEWNVPYHRIGKLIIARTEEEIPAIQELFQQGRINGVTDLEFLDSPAVSRLEPNIRAVAGILSPSTGIVDSHKLMQRLERCAEQGDALLAYRHRVQSIKVVEKGYQISYYNPQGTEELIECHWLINCAGLNADNIASMVGIDVDSCSYRIYPCKGEYFSIVPSKSGLISRLIYPPPLKDLQGLGVHVTKSLDGRIKLGPNAFYVDKPDFSVEAQHAATFYEAVKTYLHFLEFQDLQPEMAGIRPKLQGPGHPFRDFIIRHEADKGFTGLINLLGIESPGLTSCLSIAKTVGDIIEERR